MKDIESSDQLFVTLKMMYLDEQEWQEMKSKCYKEVKTEMRLCMYEGYVVVGTSQVSEKCFYSIRSIDFEPLKGA